MAIQAGVGKAFGEDSFKVGQEAIQMAVDELQAKTGTIPSLVLVFASVKYDQEQMLAGVRSVYTGSLVGSSTAGEITQEGPSSQTVVVMALNGEGVDFTVGYGPSIKEVGSHDAGKELGQNLLSESKQQGRELKSVVIFPDALVGNGADIVRGLQDSLGKEFPIVGGASGDDQKFVQTFQYYNDQVLSQSVVGFGVSGDFTFGVGVRHGWIPIGLPMKVTKSHGSVVEEIDNQPALDVYKNYFGEKNAQLLQDDKAVFTNKSVLTYPFGISDTKKSEILIRFATDVSPEGSITCAAEIPQGSEIRMMIGNKDKAIEASQVAATMAMKTINEGTHPNAVIIFNCIARNNLFGEDSYQEIQAMREVLGADVPIIGFYTYGEQAPVDGITRDIKKCETSFHNETVVIYALQ